MPKVHKKAMQKTAGRGEALREAVLSSVWKGTPCTVCKFSKEDIALILEMREDGVPYTAISRGFAKLNIKVSDQTLTRHFRGNHAK